MRFPNFLSGVFLLLPALGSAATPVTFNKDVAPIVYANCSACHRPGEAAPFSLLTYDDVKRKAKTICKATASRAMPPWKAEPASFEYRDERRLKDSEIELIKAWVEQGMVEGNAADKPAQPTFSSGWKLGEPDLIVEMPSGFHIPADGPDIYRNIPVSLGITEEKWVTAIDMKTTAREAVHHVLYFADGSGKVHTRPHQGKEPGFSGMRAGANIPLGGWAVGAQPAFFPEGLALNLPAGSDFVVQYHFHPAGKPMVEKSKIGFYFAKKPPERTTTRIQMPPHYSLFSGLKIPAGEKDFVIKDTFTLPVAVDAAGVGAHAHYIGKKMLMTATLPGGEVKTLLLIKDWDFAWQDRYYFKKLEPLPAGTRLDTEIHWDNSADNPRNPSNPPVQVVWGEESKDEMGSVSLIIVPHKQSELRALREEIGAHRHQIEREGFRADPELAGKIQRLLAE